MRSLKTFVVAFAIVWFCAEAAAQSYPTKPIRMVVPYSAGGGADNAARVVAQELSKSLGQQIIIDNRPGAGGVIGEEQVAKTAPDGYTVLFDASGFAINPALRKLPFDPLKDFIPVSQVAAAPMVLVVPPGSPHQSLADFIQYAKSHPGKVTFASAGPGSGQHLVAELFKDVAKVDMVHVPYKGGAPALTDVMGGQVDCYFANVASAGGHIKAGKLRPLAVTSSKRVTTLPNVPTMAESGYPEFDVVEWNAVFVPSGTPALVIQRLATEISHVLHQPDVRRSLEQFGLEVVGSSPQDFSKFLRNEMNQWATLIKTKRIRID
jgi:tripartite-type tricarboxylate transporter receptor subunit TctC